MDGAADVAETTYTPLRPEPDAPPVRLIVRRVKPTPGSQLALFATYSYHACITDRDGDTLELEADCRRHAEIENAIRDLKYGVGLNHLPSGRFAANAVWLAVQVMAHNLARWTVRLGLGEQIVTTRPSGDASSPWPGDSPARRAASLCIYPGTGHGKPSSVAPWHGCKPFHSRPDAARPPLTHQPANPTSPQSRARPVRGGSLLRPLPVILPASTPADGHRGPVRLLRTLRRPPLHPNGAQAISPVAASPLFPLFSCPPSVPFGGFGVKAHQIP